LRESRLFSYDRLAWLAVIPLVPFAAIFAVRVLGWSDHATLFGDAALIETATRAACHGTQLLGPYSRFGFCHPGPAMFYAFAPGYFLSGGNEGSLELSALALNAVCLAVFLRILWRQGDRAMFAVGCLAVTQFVLASRHSLASTWNPQLITFPFLLYCGAACAVAARQLESLPWMLLAGSFAVQTHVGAVAPVAMVAVTAAGIAILPNPSGESHGRKLKWAIASAFLLVLMWAPPAIEQFTHTPGNIAALWHFFSTYAGEHPLSVVLPLVTSSASTLSRSFLSGMDDVLGPGISLTAGIALAGVQWLIAVIVIVLARNEKQRFWLGLATIAASLPLIAMWTTRRVVGPLFDYLLEWVPAIGLLLLVVAGWAILSRLRRRNLLSDPRKVRLFGWVVVAFTVVSALSATVAVVASANQARPEPDDATSRDVRALSSRVVTAWHERSQRTALVRYLDESSASTMAGLVNELARAGLDVRVDGLNASKFPRELQAPAVGVRPLVVTSKAWEQFLVAQGLATIVVEGEFASVLERTDGSSLSGAVPMCALTVLAAEATGFSACTEFQGASFRWSDGDESRLVLPLQGGRDHRVILTLRPYTVAGETQSIQVGVAGQTLQTLTLPGEPRWSEVAVDIPASLATNDTSLSFRYAHTHMRTDALSSADLSRLGVAFSDIAIMPAGADR